MPLGENGTLDHNTARQHLPMQPRTPAVAIDIEHVLVQGCLFRWNPIGKLDFSGHFVACPVGLVALEMLKVQHVIRNTHTRDRHLPDEVFR